MIGRRHYSLASFSLRNSNYACAMQIYSRRILLKLLPMLDSLPDNLRDKALSYHKEVLSLIDYATEAAHHAVDAASKQLATAVFLCRHAWLRTAMITDDARNRIEDSPFDGGGLFAYSTDESLDTILKMRRTANKDQPRRATLTPPRLHPTTARATSHANASANQLSPLIANRRPDYVIPISSLRHQTVTLPSSLAGVGPHYRRERLYHRISRATTTGLLPKKDGGLRPILDLRNLNFFIRPRRFRMTTLEANLPLLNENDWFAVIDLHVAYFHISITPAHRKYLQFTVGNDTYQFKALPFGLSTSPRVFTKCLAPVAAHLHLHGINIFPYLDDWLLVSPTAQKATQDLRYTLDLLSSLGLQVNRDKSVLWPSQTVQYIGVTIDSIRAQAFLSEDRQRKILSTARLFQRSRVTDHLVQQLLGLMASTTAILPHARLRMRILQAWFLGHFNPQLHPQSMQLPLTSTVRDSLRWWSRPRNLQQGRPFHPVEPSIQLTTGVRTAPVSRLTACGRKTRQLTTSITWKSSPSSMLPVHSSSS
ncbi:hypothetical protein JRQ81_015469 [Phrynocephalus forsythii]|uniref:ribonuclease H n=1 Tax=Phrynocephalus forsythii TaxID=171643 RepID=A0A9Q0XUW5_9SAUR|nr:hypothetical protein JRQ81_015469 [Phrynocephalus forsythii]